MKCDNELWPLVANSKVYKNYWLNSSLVTWSSYSYFWSKVLFWGYYLDFAEVNLFFCFC